MMMILMTMMMIMVMMIDEYDDHDDPDDDDDLSPNDNGAHSLIDSVINQHTDPSANHNINMKKVLLVMFDHRSINYFLFDPLEITIATQLATFPSPFPLTLSAVSLPQYKRFQILPHFQTFTSGASTKLSVLSIGITLLIKTTHH